ncbi:unnamed protein product [Paramecium octaurelia]|uniref:Uncharacterized protein n=1 Tax=Paramecium octaurelia TaxID=43137 RepID=A0A8S1SSI2_PAROT|nr:unnamed protein product [Paramecium octaurelia]
MIYFLKQQQNFTFPSYLIHINIHLIDTYFNHTQIFNFLKLHNNTKGLIIQLTFYNLVFCTVKCKALVKVNAPEQVQKHSINQHMIYCRTYDQNCIQNRILIRILTVFIIQSKASYSITQLKQNLVVISRNTQNSYILDFFQFYVFKYQMDQQKLIIIRNCILQVNNWCLSD